MATRNIWRWRTVFLGTLLCLAVGTPSNGWTSETPDIDQEPPIKTTGGEIHVDPFTGVATTSVPIEVVPGRNGLQPHLQLVYSSAGGNGPVGMGWMLEIGSIERLAKRGVCYACAEYVLRLNGVSYELVSIGNDEFRVKQEGVHFRIKQLGVALFEVTDTKGVVYTFGYSLYDPSDSSRVYRWNLNVIRDPDGNQILATYYRDSDNNQDYLDSIQYTGGDSIEKWHQVRFYRESRPDVYDSYLSGFLMRTAYRYKTIQVLAESNIPVRAYKLSYDANRQTSVLSNVQQFGKDATFDGSMTVTGGTALPAVSFGWSKEVETVNPWTTASLGGSSPALPVSEQCLSGDLNGDAKTDYWCESSSLSGQWHVMLSAGNGWTGSYWNGPGAITPVRNYCFTGDLDGDGRTDFFCQNTEFSGVWEVGLSTENGWNHQVWNGPAVQLPVSRPCMTGDLDGNGLTDIWCETAIQTGSWWTGLSNGTGWVVTERSGPVVAWPVGRYCLSGDLNGDGKSDFWCQTGSGTGRWKAAITYEYDPGFLYGWYVREFNGTAPATPVGNQCLTGDLNGDGKTDTFCQTSTPNIWNISLSRANVLALLQSVNDDNLLWSMSDWAGPAPAVPVGSQCVTGDFNGDGKTDVICETGSGTGIWDVRLSMGNRWAGYNWSRGPSPAVTPTSPLIGYQCLSGDLNGDGKTDIWCQTGNASGTWQTATVNGFKPNLLTGASNGLKAAFLVQYRSSSDYANYKLPFPVQTVLSLVKCDSPIAVDELTCDSGNLATTSYSYAGGFYYSKERDFRGFHTATETGPADSSGNRTITTTWFHQGNDVGTDVNNYDVPHGYMKGKPYRVLVKDGQQRS